MNSGRVVEKVDMLMVHKRRIVKREYKLLIGEIMCIPYTQYAYSFGYTRCTNCNLWFNVPENRCPACNVLLKKQNRDSKLKEQTFERQKFGLKRVPHIHDSHKKRVASALIRLHQFRENNKQLIKDVS